MNNLNIRKTLLGLSLLGATAFAGLATPAQAKPRDRDDRQDVKEARKELKKTRKEVRKADSREERRDAREDVRDARKDLREERRENGNRPGYGYGRPSNGANRPGYGRPGYVRPQYNRPRYNRSNTDASNANRVLEGVVLQDLNGNDFTIRTGAGQIVRVLAVNGESSRISRGDTVRVSGIYSGSTFRAQSVSILRNR